MGAAATNICGNVSPYEKLINKYHGLVPLYFAVEQGKHLLDQKITRLKYEVNQAFDNKKQQLQRLQRQVQDKKRQLTVFAEHYSPNKKIALTKQRMNAIVIKLKQILDGVPISELKQIKEANSVQMIKLDEVMQNQMNRLNSIQDKIPQYEKLSDKDKKIVYDRVVGENRILMHTTKTVWLDQMGDKLKLETYLKSIEDLLTFEIFQMIDAILNTRQSTQQKQIMSIEQINQIFNNLKIDYRK